MPFLEALSDILKLPEDSNDDTKESHCKKMLSLAMQNLAENFRTHSSECLMKRGARRAMDEGAPSVLDGSIGTASHNNGMVLIFACEVNPELFKAGAKQRHASIRNRLLVIPATVNPGAKYPHQ